MKKKNLDNNEVEKISEDKKLVSWSKVRTLNEVNALLSKYKEVYIINPYGMPIKITKAELS